MASRNHIERIHKQNDEVLKKKRDVWDEKELVGVIRSVCPVRPTWSINSRTRKETRYAAGFLHTELDFLSHLRTRQMPNECVK